MAEEVRCPELNREFLMDYKTGCLVCGKQLVYIELTRLAWEPSAPAG